MRPWLLACGCALATPAHAQGFPPTPPPAPPPSPDGSNITVTAARPRGAIPVDARPEVTFDFNEIATYGADTIEDLLARMAPQLASGRGASEGGGTTEPVVLLNGKRVSGFAEVARIPAEAILRMEVFPAETALKFGYPADQKVVNVVTHALYASLIGNVELAAPTAGDRSTQVLNANLTRIRDDARINLDIIYSRSDSLRESDRRLAQADDAPDAGRFRTLLPRSERLTLNGALSRALVRDVSSAVNVRFDANQSASLLGRAGAGQALTRAVKNRAVNLGTTHSGRLGQWQWIATGAYDRSTFRTTLDLAANAAPDTARSTDTVAKADLLLSGAALTLPAGPLWASLRANFVHRDFASATRRSGAAGDAIHLSRDSGGFLVSLDAPIASKAKRALASLGSLATNASFGLERLSDFDTLRTVSYGVTWTPIAALSFSAAATREKSAPTMEQLGAPFTLIPNVRLYDFARAEVVSLAHTTAGNRDLRAANRRTLRLGAVATPLAKTDLTLSIDYLDTRAHHPILTAPLAGPELEAAFPERFTRGPDGQLLAFDASPLNFDRARQRRLQWGVNFTQSLAPGVKPVRTTVGGSQAEIQRKLPPGAKMIMVEPVSPAARRLENMSSRLVVSLYHTARLADTATLRKGSAAIDRLDGSALDARGGAARHEVAFHASALKRGLGAAVSAVWRSGTTARNPTSAAAAGDLRFSSTTIVTLDALVNLEQRFAGPRSRAWLRDTRVTLQVANLLNDRPEVRDASGSAPLIYQSAYLDPLGRTIALKIRKMF